MLRTQKNDSLLRMPRMNHIWCILLFLPLSTTAQRWGHWESAFSDSVYHMPFSLELQLENGDTICHLTTPSEHALYYRSTDFSRHGDRIDIAFRTLGNTTTCRVDFDQEKNAMAGVCEQGDHQIPLAFRRADHPVRLVRPQAVVDTNGYQQMDVRFQNAKDDIWLAGTLCIPEGLDTYPMAVFITGSGPQDRDESVFGHKPFQLIAHALAQQGIASLRFDDRGTAASEGLFHTATGTDFANDVYAALHYLTSDWSQAITHIGLIGHSEGGMIAQQIASESDVIDFIVLLASPGSSNVELMTIQNRKLLELYDMDEKALAENAVYCRTLFGLLASEQANEALYDTIMQLSKSYYESLPKAMRGLFGASPEAYYLGLASQVFRPWFREFLRFDARFYLPSVTCPVLALNGSKDLQVTADENLTGIESALRAGRCMDVTIRAFENLNHLFQNCESGAFYEYGLIEETFDVEALGFITEWIADRTK